MLKKSENLDKKTNELLRIICLVIVLVVISIISYRLLDKDTLWPYEINSRIAIICLTTLFMFICVYFEINKNEIFFITLLKIVPSILLIFIFRYINLDNINYVPLLLPITLICIFYGTRPGYFTQLFAITLYYFTNHFSAEICIFYMIFGLIVVYMIKYSKSIIEIIMSSSIILIIYAILSMIFQYMTIEKISYIKILIGIIPLFFSIVPIYSQWILKTIYNKQLDIKLKEFLRDDYFLIEKLVEENPTCYYHSLEVSDLAVNVAKRLNANISLVNAGSRYHEIGRLISKNYVSAGIKILTQYKFPKEVINIVRQHNSKINKPETIESAIVMLSDTIISTINTVIENKGADKINKPQIVKNILEIRLESGMLDKAVLTTSDYVSLKNAFIDIYKY